MFGPTKPDVERKMSLRPSPLVKILSKNRYELSASSGSILGLKVGASTLVIDS